MIERIPLPFDGAVTGASMARLRLPDGPAPSDAALAAALADARADGVRHVVASVESSRTDVARVLSRAGLGLVDVSVDFRRPRREAPIEPDDGVRIGDAGDADAVIAACGHLFTRSRYYTDPFFEEAQGHEVHRRWIQNLFGGRAAGVLVARDADEVVGFAGLLRDDATREGRIDLIAVAPGAGGRGWGRRLLEQSLRWFDARCDVSFVKTQAHNTRAGALYTRAGYTLHQTDLTYAATL